VDYIKAAYDNGIAYMDKRLSELFERLKPFPWFKNTVFALTSDHGEAFHQHPGVVVHGGLPYGELVHVPFLMLGPGVPVNRRISALTASIDIAPTLAELAEVSIPVGFQGRSLVPLLRGERMKNPVVLAGSKDAQRLSFQDERWKLILDMREGQVMLFDLKSPAGEGKDVSTDHPEIAGQLKKKLLEYEKTNQRAGAGIIRGRLELDDKTRARLREMGYIK
jgi:arylsulfatase A-like enzyme